MKGGERDRRGAKGGGGKHDVLLSVDAGGGVSVSPGRIHNCAEGALAPPLQGWRNHETSLPRPLFGEGWPPRTPSLPPTLTKYQAERRQRTSSARYTEWCSCKGLGEHFQTSFTILKEDPLGEKYQIPDQRQVQNLSLGPQSLCVKRSMRMLVTLTNLRTS